MAHVTDDTNIVINGEYSGIDEAKDNMIDALGHNYFDSIPDFGLEMSELGFVLEHIGDITKDSLNATVTSINEYFPATAIIPESIASHAAIFNIDNTFTQCAECVVDIILNEEEILKYGTKIIDKDTGKQHTKFYLDKNTTFIINEIQYVLDYDVEIIIGEKNTDVDTSVSTYKARYIIGDTKNSISNIENPTLDIIKIPQGNIRLRLNTHQVVRNTINDTIINNTKINYPVLLFEFNDYLAGFDIMYKASTDNVFRQLKTLPKYSSPVNEDFCYYTLKDDNTLEISFTSNSNYFQPEFNSDIKLIMYITEGEAANFETSLTTEVSVQTSSQVYEYNKNINIVARTQSNSSGAKNRLSSSLIKTITTEAHSTATDISTNNDLKIFFANYEEKYGDIVSVKKKYDDITSRLYCLYLLLKDKDYIFPTNTCILDINLNDFDVKTTLYDHPVYSLLPGHTFVYKDLYLESADTPTPKKPDCPLVLANAQTTEIDKKRYSPQDAENLIDKYVWNADDGTYTITPAVVVEDNSTNKIIETDEYEYAVYLGPVSGPYESIPKPTKFTCVYNLYHFLPCTDDDNIAPPYSVYWNDYCDVMGMANRKVEVETGPMYENMEIEYFDGWDILDREANDDTAWWVTDPEDNTRVYVYHQPYYWYSTRRLLTEARKESANPYGTKCVEHIEAETTDYWGNVDTCEFRPVKFKELQTMPYSEIEEMFGAHIDDYTSNIKKARTRYKCEMSYCEVTQDSDGTVYIRIAEAYPTEILNATDAASSGVLWKYKKLKSSSDYVFDGGSTILRAGALTSESTYARSNWMYDDYPLYTVSLFYLITTKNRNTICTYEVTHESGYIDASVQVLDEYDWIQSYDDSPNTYTLFHFSPASSNCIPYYMEDAIYYDEDSYRWNQLKYTEINPETGEHSNEISDLYNETLRIFDNPMGKYTWVECYEDYDSELNSRVWYVIDTANNPNIAYIYHECYYYPIGFDKNLISKNEIFSDGEGSTTLLWWYRFEYEYDSNDQSNPFKPMEIQTIPIDEIPDTATYLGCMPSTYKYSISQCDTMVLSDGDVIIQQYPYRSIITYDRPQNTSWGIGVWDYINYHYTSYSDYHQDCIDNNLTETDSFELHYGYLFCLEDIISNIYAGYYYANEYGIDRDRYPSGVKGDSMWKYDGARVVLDYNRDYPESTVPLLRLLTTRPSSYIEHNGDLVSYNEEIPTRCKEVNISYIAEEPIKDIIETIDTDEFDLVIKLGTYGTSWEDYWKNENAQESYALLHFSPATENCTAKILSDIVDLHNSYSRNDERHGYEWNQFRDLWYHITRTYLVGREEKQRTWNKSIDDIFTHRFSHPMSRYTTVEYYEDYDSTNKSKIWYVVDIEKDPNTAYIYNERDLYFDVPSGSEAIRSLYNSQNAFDYTAEKTADMLFGRYMFEYNCILSNILSDNWDAFNEYEFKTIPVDQIPSTAIKYPRARPTAYKYDVIRYDLISVDDSGEVIIEEFPFTDVDIFDEPKSTDQGFQPWQYTTSGDYNRHLGESEYQRIYTNYKAYYDDAIRNNRKLKRGLEQHTNFIFGAIEYLFDKYDDERYNGIERSMYDSGDAGTIEWKANVLKSKLTYYDYPEDSVSLLKLLTTLRPRPGDYQNIKGLEYFSVRKPPDYGTSCIYSDTDARFPTPKNCKITKYYGEDFLTDEYEYFKAKNESNENNILYHLSPATENSVFGILGSMLNDKKNGTCPYDTNVIEYGANRVISLKNNGEQHGVDMSWIDEYLRNTDYIAAFYDHPMVRHTNVVYYEDFDDTLNSRVWYIVDIENEPNIAYVYHECYYKYFSRDLDYQDIYCPDTAEYVCNIEWFEQKLSEDKQFMYPQPIQKISTNDIPPSAKFYSRKRPSRYKCTASIINTTINNDDTAIITKMAPITIVSKDAEDWDRYGWHRWDYAKSYLFENPEESLVFHTRIPNFLWNYVFFKKYDGDNEEISYDDYCARYSNTTENDWKEAVMRSKMMYEDYPETTVSLLFILTDNNRTTKNIYNNETHPYFSGYLDTTTASMVYNYNNTSEFVYTAASQPGDPLLAKHLKESYMINSNNVLINYYGSLPYSEKCYAYTNDHENVYADYNYIETNDSYCPVNCNGYRCAETKIDYYLKDEFPLNTVPRVDLATDWQVNENHPEYTYWTDSDTNIEYAHIDPSLYNISNLTDAERLALFASIDYDKTCQDLVDEYQYNRTAQFKELGAFYFNVYDIDGNKVSTITRNYLRALILKGYVTVSYNDTPVMVYETSRFNDVCNNNHFVFTTPYYILFSKDLNKIYLYQTIQKQSIILNNVLVQDSNKTVNEYFVTSRLDVVKNFSEQNAYTISLTIEPTISNNEYITATTDSDGNTIFTNSKVRVIVKFMKNKHEESDEYLELYPISQDENNKLVVTFSGTCVIDNSIGSNKTIVYVPKNSDLYTPYMDSDWNGDADSSDKIELPINGNILNIYILYTTGDNYSGNLDSMYDIANIYTTPIDSFSFYKLITTMECRTNQYDDNVYDNGENHVEIVSVPVIKANLIADDTAIHKLLSTVNTNINTVENASTKFDNDINFDIKFYNTYGRSRNYVIEGDVAISTSTDIEEDDKNTYIDTITSTDSIQYNHYTMDIGSVNISLSLDVYVSDSTDIDILDEKLRLHIKEFIESINKDGVNNLYISNLITSLEKEFDEIRYIKFNGIDDWGSSYQTITAGNSLIAPNTELFTQKFVTETNALYNSVPEFLNIKTNDITLNIITS